MQQRVVGRRCHGLDASVQGVGQGRQAGPEEAVHRRGDPHEVGGRYGAGPGDEVEGAAPRGDPIQSAHDVCPGPIGVAAEVGIGHASEVIAQVEAILAVEPPGVRRREAERGVVHGRGEQGEAGDRKRRSGHEQGGEQGDFVQARGDALRSPADPPQGLALGVEHVEVGVAVRGESAGPHEVQAGHIRVEQPVGDAILEILDDLGRRVLDVTATDTLGLLSEVERPVDRSGLHRGDVQEVAVHHPPCCGHLGDHVVTGRGHAGAEVPEPVRHQVGQHEGADDRRVGVGVEQVRRDGDIWLHDGPAGACIPTTGWLLAVATS